jgi:signal transduction histidine kinase
MADGGLIEPIPYETPLREGATHLLVLRSRPAGYRKPALSELGESLALRDNPNLVDLFKARPRLYNRQAAELQRVPASRRDDAHVVQVAVPDGTRLVGRLGTNGDQVTNALRLGARAMASMILTDAIDLCWQPVVYRAAPLGGKGRVYRRRSSPQPRRHGLPISGLATSWTLGDMTPSDVFDVLNDDERAGLFRRSSEGLPHSDGSPARIVEAFDQQRQMLERDLHDGVQQRLVAVRIRLELAVELASGDALLDEILDEIGAGVDAAIEELRDVAHGIYPHLLSDHGVLAALQQVARAAGSAVSVRGRVGRYPAQLESAIYYCCREAIQNASKHGGRGTQIVVSLREDAHTIYFEVADDGPGFDVSARSGGKGLQHMRDRIAAVGGELSIGSSAGGTVVAGSIPRSR